MEIDVVKPLKPKFYNRYVDDICSKELKNQPDQPDQQESTRN